MNTINRSKVLKNLSPAKRELLLRALRQDILKTQVSKMIPRRPRQSQAPLSFGQQRLWFLHQLEPNLSAYHIHLAVKLTGRLDQAILAKALNEIVRRHEMLRTTFEVSAGQPVQVIVAADEVPGLVLRVNDLQAVPQVEQIAHVRQLAIQQARQPFDLANGPHLRATLFKLAPRAHVLSLTMHHIVSDGWSTGILIKELAQLYHAFANGSSLSLPALPIQYADYATWQQEWLQGKVLEEQLAYWKQRLEKSLPVLELPGDYVRPAVQSFRGARHAVRFPALLSQGLRELSRQQGATLFMTLLAAYKALLYRYTAQKDIIVGSPIANRNRAEIEGLIGLFINMLVLRTDLSGNPTFAELIDRVHKVAVGAFTHPDLPFEKLVEELQPQRDLSRSPLFQVIFVMQNAPGDIVELPALKMSLLPVDLGATHYDLSVHVFEHAHDLEGIFEYNADLFKPETIARLAQHYLNLLEQVVADPTTRLANLKLLSKAERQQMLVEWNTNQVDYTADQYIHQVLEERAACTPDLVAVVFQDQHLTCQALNRHANQLASYLQARGVGPDRLVGIYTERSVETMVGILGTLKAGGAYVPLDATYPAERLAFMLADTQPLVLLTQSELVANLPEHQSQTICLDTQWRRVAQEPDQNLVSRGTMNNLAYVIYTSGSTGKPKGVLVPHRGLLNVAENMVRTFGLTSDDRVLQFSSLSFDASVYDILMALGSGAALCLTPGDLLPDQSLVHWLQNLGVTVIALTASVLAALPVEQLYNLRVVISGAEACPAGLVARWCQSRRFFNVYGPTEASIWATVAECTDDGQDPTIGRPIANAQLYILDELLQPLPIGVAGELCIGGAGVTRGYLNSPALTAAKFAPHPFSTEPGARLYRTGDLARYLPDGRIDFLGRIDRQVKIRGFRIELGEIETVLDQHRVVREAVVLAREDTPGNKQLVAYVVLSEGETLVSGDLRRFLEAKLPAYMVPATFVTLDAFPLTPNDKIDRRALPAPGRTRSKPDGDYVAPRSFEEQTLAHIWAEVLGLERVGVFDNFFALGGDSILSIQITAQANQAGIQLATRQIFQYQTIAELVAAGIQRQTVPVSQEMVVGEVPLTPIQHWFFEQNFTDPHHWNQAVLLESKQALGPVLLEQVVRQLLTHHDALRLRFYHDAQDWRQVNMSVSEATPFICIDLSRVPPTDRSHVLETAAAEAQASLNLSNGPLVRVVLFHLSDQPDRVLIIIHHLAVDGISWRILLEDMLTLYQQLARGEAFWLAPKTTSFQEWATRLGDYAQSTALQSELDYWLPALKKEFYPLPLDKTGGANTTRSARGVSVRLDRHETQALLHQVPTVYQTQINDALLTALLYAFTQWTGKPALLCELEGHGREEIFESVDLTRTVGWFTSLFPVWLELENTWFELGKALKFVKEQLRQLPRQGMGYGLLRYLSGDQAIINRLQAAPRAQVSFNYLGQFDQVFQETALFRLLQENSGPTRSLRGKRTHLIEINSLVSNGELAVFFNYSENLHNKRTIERLSQDFLDALREIIAHCLSPDAGGYTPSDFPEAGLSQAALEHIMAQVGDIGE